MNNKVKFLFESEIEAMAFIAGVNYVNDSGIFIDTVVWDKKGNTWQVLIEDESSPEAEDGVYDLTNPSNLLFVFGETTNLDVEQPKTSRNYWDELSDAIDEHGIGLPGGYKESL